MSKVFLLIEFLYKVHCIPPSYIWIEFKDVYVHVLMEFECRVE